jgi:dihydrodipicolinate synthase/N-acetylneuraminate lyase
MTTPFVQKNSFDEQSVARKCVWLILATFTFLVCLGSTVAIRMIVPKWVKTHGVSVHDW